MLYIFWMYLDINPLSIIEVNSVDVYIWIIFLIPFKVLAMDFPGGSVVKNLPANAGDTGSSPGLGRSHMSQSN